MNKTNSLFQNGYPASTTKNKLCFWQRVRTLSKVIKYFFKYSILSIRNVCHDHICKVTEYQIFHFIKFGSLQRTVFDFSKRKKNLMKIVNNAVTSAGNNSSQIKSYILVASRRIKEIKYIILKSPWIKGFVLGENSISWVSVDYYELFLMKIQMFRLSLTGE